MRLSREKTEAAAAAVVIVAVTAAAVVDAVTEEVAAVVAVTIANRAGKAFGKGVKGKGKDSVFHYPFPLTLSPIFIVALLA